MIYCLLITIDCCNYVLIFRRNYSLPNDCIQITDIFLGMANLINLIWQLSLIVVKLYVLQSYSTHLLLICNTVLLQTILHCTDIVSRIDRRFYSTWNKHNELLLFHPLSERYNRNHSLLLKDVYTLLLQLNIRFNVKYKKLSCTLTTQHLGTEC